MCGIAGYLQLDGAPANEHTIEQMAALMQHRGPDDEGYFTSGPVALGFRRLSIIDLSSGHQPLGTADGNLTIIFNGEIYNYRELRRVLETDHGATFRTNSDTEVILQAYAAWGSKCLGRLNGMFAFAIWDEAHRELFLARDRVGKKPLYYARAGETFVFASEIKVLVAHEGIDAQPDRERVAAFLAYRYVPQHETLLKNVYALPPGHSMVVRAGSDVPQPVCYWDYEFADPPLPPAAPERDLEALLWDAVRLRMIADVPFGAFLSGGLDSSLIVALMSKMHPGPLKTFSIGFDTGFSEEGYARRVAAQFDCDHHEVIVGSRDLIDNIPRVLHARETPISEPSDIPIFLLSQLARTKVTVVLSGEGSDEVFAGYPKYAFENMVRSRFGFVPPDVYRMLSRLMPFGMRDAQLALACVSQNDRYERMACWFGAFGPEERMALLSPDLLQTDVHAYARSLSRGKQFPSAVEEMLYQDMKHWLPANLLLRGDRMTMAHSLELRCPFLDYRIVEYAATALPRSMKIRGMNGKVILKNIARRLLPADIVDRKKWGFKVPIAGWMRQGLRSSVEDVLLSPRARGRGYYHESELRRIINLHTSGRVNYQKQLWAMYQLELWHLMFIDRVLAPTDSLT